jgi:hypothetical protein
VTEFTISDLKESIGTNSTLAFFYQVRLTVIKVEQEAAHILVIDLPASVSLVLRYYLENISTSKIIETQISLPLTVDLHVEA